MADVRDLTELRDVDRAVVGKAGRAAGTLTREGDDVVFRYEDDYLADPLAPPLAWTLPKSDEPRRATGGAVLPFFAGLLPEGLRLTALQTATRTSIDDHVTLLLAVGQDAIGDVTVRPEGEPEAVPTALWQPGSSTSLREVFAAATSTDPDVVDRSGLPGVQVKVSALMESTPVATTTGPAILKLDPQATPGLVRNEHFVMSMAQACGLLTARQQLVSDASGEQGLLVERFDRGVDDGVVRRFAQEDACQVLGKYPAAKYRITAQEAFRALRTVVEAWGGSGSATALRALELYAFSYLVGNGDLHAKNLSVGADASGVWALTPAYDLLCTQPYLHWKDRMALPLLGRDSKVTRRHLRESAEHLGVPVRALDRVLDRMLGYAEPWTARVQEAGMTDSDSERFADLLRDRSRELAG